MSGNDNQFNRRSVLKTVGSAAVAGIGLGASSNSVAAVETKRRLTRAYSDERRLRAAFEQHAEDIRRTLVAENFVAEEFAFSDLTIDIDPNESGLDPTAEDGRAGVTGVTEDGTATAFASVSTSSETHELTLFVQPERDEAYALVEPADGGDRMLVTDSEVRPQGCIKDECTTDCCGGDKESYLKQYECDVNCENCNTLIGTSCSCETCECATSGHVC